MSFSSIPSILNPRISSLNTHTKQFKNLIEEEEIDEDSDEQLKVGGSMVDLLKAETFYF